MPLGLFSSGKAQVLSDEKPAGSKKKEPKQLSENKCKGVTLKLDHTRVTIEKQIAEGGFAIVYIASDRKNNKFALKRQFTKENQKQLDACCREHSFLKQCVGHKNIVEFVDSYVNCLGNGIWECMLLTEYHHKNVLQLMNERISQNQYLSSEEILSIFCDLCEAVFFIHHRPPPIVHRDLKVENVLISSHKPPNYVLCDFGSATTQILSVDKFGVEYVKSEVERNTTMCYRSPEMIDFYSGQVLGLKGDIWAMGVLLYRLCFFSVPFDESPLAIQSGNYQFPSFPNVPDEIKVLIYMILDIDVNRRPTILQTSSLAFEAHRKAMPREMEERKSTEVCPSLDACLRLMRDGGKPRNQKDVSPPPSRAVAPPLSMTPLAPSAIVTSSASTSSTVPPLAPPTTSTVTGETSVAPRLRPKGSAVPMVPSISPVPSALKLGKDETDNGQFKKPADLVHRQSFSGEDNRLKAVEGAGGGPLSCPLIKPADLGFTDLDKPALPRDRAQTDGKRRIPPEAEAIFQQQHRRNVSDTSQISRSAFKPYSSQQSKACSSQVRSVEDMSNRAKNRGSGEWNPFLEAPFSTNSQQKQLSKLTMDDSHFGMVFDEIRRKGVPPTTDPLDSDTSSIDSRDPFGAAPFDQLTVSTCSSSAPPISIPPANSEDDERQLLSESENEEEAREEVEIETQTAKETNTEEDSEIDEQRMNDRRRYSYENIDGVGDDASSDSRGRTDRDDSEEEEEEEEGDADSRRGDDTSLDEDSQNTVGSEDGEGGSRPLLEDDGLEDDDDHELISSFSSSSHTFPPLFIGTSSPLLQNPTTNPFLRDELTPKMISPRPTANVRDSSSVDDDWDLGDRWTDRRDTVFERPAQQSAFAPATLPRQVTPLAAVCKLKPDLPTAAPVSIIPSMSTTSFPEAVRVSENSAPCEPIIGTLISVGAPTDPPKSIRLESPPKNHKKPEKLAKKEKKKEKKEHKKGKEKEKGSSELETDGSEAEMWAADGGTLSKRKKKSTFGLRSSHPSIGANDLPFVATVAKRSSKDKKAAVKKSSVGNVLNASFVNTSFQPEDPDAHTNL
ncbi:unnamed protein product [Caenorhabditis sp. 36 PRJEB53466]|nr:unnamed protein product [Caenorhabditis sp. 36 PRJEB53466]